MFKSFFMGGFECATHRRRDGLQIDVIGATAHDSMAARDYRLLQSAGIRTVRDGLRWHRIETAPGVFCWDSFLPMLESSLETGTQVIWDLCHWGLPAGLDVFSPEFVERFAAFSAGAARVMEERSSEVPFFCPVNEMSFWAWVGGDQEHFAPYASGRGAELKRQLARASIAAMRAVRSITPRARFVHPEPIIHIGTDNSHTPEQVEEARRYTASQYEAWDLLSGALDAEGVGGSPDMLDILGVNFYWNNEWVHFGERAPLGHAKHRPLHEMLRELQERYHRPILISETGAESGAGAGWIGYIGAEVRQAQRGGVEIAGICLYPVMDYVGWDDRRHCSCGLIEVDAGWQTRRLRSDLVNEVLLQAHLQQKAVMLAASEPTLVAV